MKRYKFWLLLLLSFFFLSSCKSINRTRMELDIPQSVVIFSFDDGPNAQGDTTARLLDVLNKYQIKAIFSLLGENVEQYPELTRRIYDEGHYIVNHGYANIWACAMYNDEFKLNLDKGKTAISAVLGHDIYPTLYRPHGGFYTSGQEKILQEAGYTLVPANIRIYDDVITGKQRAKVVRKVIRKTGKQGGGIVLLHDSRGSHSRMEKELVKKPQGAFNRSWIPEVMEEIIITLMDKGFIINSSVFNW